LSAVCGRNSVLAGDEELAAIAGKRQAKMTAALSSLLPGVLSR
jgi:hypothetical protein